MRFRLISWLTLFLAIVLLGSSLVLYFYLKQNLIESAELRLSNWADDSLVEIAENPGLFQKNPAKFILPAKTNEFAGSRMLVQFMDRSGQLLARSPGLKLNSLPFSIGDDDVLKEVVLEDGTQLKVYQRLINVEGKDLGYIIVGLHTSYITGVLDNLRNILIVVMFCVLVILGLGVNAFASLNVIERQKRFLSFASHELRTPLSIISGNAELALRGDPAREEYKETLKTIKEESDWMNKLVANFLFVSRSEMGGEKPKKMNFNFGELLAEAASSLKKRYPSKNITINLPDEATIKADPDRLRQVVNNLLENAASHTSADGKIAITLSDRPRQYVLEIADNGTGIEKTLQKKIFDAFYRIEQKENEGMGLGLAITKWIVASHGGRIEVKSEKGLGAAFTVYLPK
ncbi:MAG: HAMP domain-containing sensor histidine kinase [Candidatus Margulisbacteria bacterium]|nr:HAMP domain-containing sensor histidine kinase [Candidatus Margulisiibacteriota bacterium]